MIGATLDMTAAMGSISEGQEFFGSDAKPQVRFPDRATASLMTGSGWLAAIQRKMLGVIFNPHALAPSVLTMLFDF